MKRNELNQIKTLNLGELILKAKAFQKELVDLSLEQNANRVSKDAKGSKDLRQVFKKRKDLAQILTILRQKQILSELESMVKKGQTPDHPKEEVKLEKPKAKVKKGGSKRLDNNVESIVENK